MIGNHLPVGVGHGAHAVPAVVGGIVDKSTNIRYARHYGVLQHVVVRSNCILLIKINHERKIIIHDRNERISHSNSMVYLQNEY